LATRSYRQQAASCCGYAYDRRDGRRSLLSIIALLGLGSRLAVAEPQGTLTNAVHFTPLTRWLDAVEAESIFRSPSPDFPAFYGTFAAGWIVPRTLQDGSFRLAKYVVLPIPRVELRD
jgi:hypothetical protein